MTTTPISEYAVNGLAQFLKTKHGLTDEQAVKRAEWIMRDNAYRAVTKKLKLAQAQTMLTIDGLPAEEPVSKYEQEDSLPF